MTVERRSWLPTAPQTRASRLDHTEQCVDLQEEEEEDPFRACCRVCCKSGSEIHETFPPIVERSGARPGPHLLNNGTLASCFPCLCRIRSRSRSGRIFRHWAKCLSVSRGEGGLLSFNTTGSWSGEVLPLVAKEVLRGSVGFRRSVGLGDAMAVEVTRRAPRTVRVSSSGWTLESAVQNTRARTERPKRLEYQKYYHNPYEWGDIGLKGRRSDKWAMHEVGMSSGRKDCGETEKRGECAWCGVERLDWALRRKFRLRPCPRVQLKGKVWEIHSNRIK